MSLPHLVLLVLAVAATAGALGWFLADRRRTGATTTEEYEASILEMR